MAIAVQADPGELEDLKKIFKALDTDGSGSIDFAELQTGLGERENAHELLEILKAADTDGNGQINYTEFLAATMTQQTYAREEYLKTSFNLLDKDGSGKIDSSELL